MPQQWWRSALIGSTTIANSQPTAGHITNSSSTPSLRHNLDI
ncbi:hypothetical protein [Tengunoibacter tsumagoiensis]|nr:hypothetical protein [Tengunoibacter tsumagoiensis]